MLPRWAASMGFSTEPNVKTFIRLRNIKTKRLMNVQNKMYNAKQYLM